MKWLIVGVGGIVMLLVLAAAVAWGVGRAMPAQHEATVTRDIAASPAQVAAVVRNVEAQPGWRPGVRRIDVTERQHDVLRYVEHGPNGAMPFAFREVEPGRVFTSTIDTDSLPFGGVWTIELSTQTGDHTVVRITERGVVRPAVFRSLAKYVFGHTRTMQQYVEALDMHLRS